MGSWYGTSFPEEVDGGLIGGMAIPIELRYGSTTFPLPIKVVTTRFIGADTLKLASRRTTSFHATSKVHSLHGCLAIAIQTAGSHLHAPTDLHEFENT